MSSLSGFLGNAVGHKASDAIAAEVALIAVIEQGYHGIVSQLETSPAGKMTPEIRVNASIKRACSDINFIERQREAIIANSGGLNLLSGLRLPDGNGSTFSPDAALATLAQTTAMTLIMEAYKNNWFKDEIVEVPSLSIVDEPEITAAGITQILAVVWSQWEQTEKRRRYIGGDFVNCETSTLPPGTPLHYNTVIDYRPPDHGFSELEVYDTVANMRLQDRDEQNFLDMEIEGRISDKAVGVTGGASLPPVNWLSADEIHAIASMSDNLHYDVVTDAAEPAGIGLIEWVRGYAVLKEIAREKSANAKAADDYYVVLDQQEVLGKLKACGLDPERAIRFIELTSLHRSARDMFDCPLVRIGDSKLLVFVPALLHLNISITVLSNLSNRGCQLGRKGKSFETAMQSMFKDHGLAAFSFTARRDGEEYEFDLVVPWDGYLFLFECKNRSLSGKDPVAAYYFEIEVQSAARQARRLRDALIKYPEIIEKHVGPGYEHWNIVPCVLHSLPYSRAGALDDVFFADASALARFFGEPYYKIKVPYKVGQVTVVHRTAIKKLWDGDKPAPKDLLKHLDDPHQLDLVVRHLDLMDFGFAVSETVVIYTHELFRNQYTTRSVCEAVGADPDEIQKIIDDHAKVIGEVLDQHRNDEKGPGANGRI